jgi:hypothetical protein
MVAARWLWHRLDMSGTARVMVFVAFITATPTSAHGGEAILCMPFVWAFEVYKTCVVGCVECGTCCCPGRRATADDDRSTPAPEQPPDEDDVTPISATPDRARGTFLH